MAWRNVDKVISDNEGAVKDTLRNFETFTASLSSNGEKITSIISGNGHFADVAIDCNGEAVTARITRQSGETLGLTPGKPVFAVVKSVTFDSANTTRAAANDSRPVMKTTSEEKVR